MYGRLLILGGALCASLALWACGDGSIAACSNEPDVTGAWRLQLSPAPADAGADASIESELAIEAQLEQAGATDFLAIGHFVYGTLTASDPRYFSTLTIPRLLQNDGSKSGAIVGCTLSINVPIASPVLDDNTPQGPMRISLVGQIPAPGTLRGIAGSQLVLEGEPGERARAFAWTGARVATP